MMLAHHPKLAIFDIDGTLAMMDKTHGTYDALPGATEALAACRDRGIGVWAYTNGTFFPPEHYYPRLADAGIVIDAGQVMTPASVAAHHLRVQGHRTIMVLGAEGTRLPVQQAGLEVVLPTEHQGAVDAVLIGWCKDFNLPQLEAVTRAIWDGAAAYTVSDAPYFAGAKGRILGVSGAISAMLAQTTERPPIVLGKPSRLGIDLITAQTGIAAPDMVVIGDDPRLEIRMARTAGAHAIGVTTGISDRASFLAEPEDWRADLVVASLLEVLERPWLTAKEHA